MRRVVCNDHSWSVERLCKPSADGGPVVAMPCQRVAGMQAPQSDVDGSVIRHGISCPDLRLGDVDGVGRYGSEIRPQRCADDANAADFNDLATSQNGNIQALAVGNHGVEGGMRIDARVEIVISRHPNDREFKSTTLPLPLQPFDILLESVCDISGDDENVGIGRRERQIEMNSDSHSATVMISSLR